MRSIIRNSLIPLKEYAGVRGNAYKEMAEWGKMRRVELGPIATMTFESLQSMSFQVQEMLYVEGVTEEAGIDDELDAYVPMVPSSDTGLKATFMLHIDNPVKRKERLRQLTGIEDHLFLVDSNNVRIAQAETVGDEDGLRTAPDGKTSAVHFLRFPVDLQQLTESGDTVSIKCDHENYQHSVQLSQPLMQSLRNDLKD